MRARLTIEAGEAHPSTCDLTSDAGVTVGRHRTNGLVIQAKHASRHHPESARQNRHSLLRDSATLNPHEPLPRMVLPEQAPVDAHLSRYLTQQVQASGRSFWLGATVSDPPDSESLASYRDALCVPLRVGETTLGALHVYRSARVF